jgi:hypothetical protein
MKNIEIKINNWEDIRNILQKKFKHTKGCMDFFPEKDCQLCNKYKEMIDYQQNIAKTKYAELSPIKTWNKSFKDTVKYLEEQIK